MTGTVPLGGLGGSYNTDDDPLLADPDGQDNVLGTEDDDVRLTSGSSAIDTASDAAVPDDTFDVDRDGDADEPLPMDLARGDRFLGTGPRALRHGLHRLHVRRPGAADA